MASTSASSIGVSKPVSKDPQPSVDRIDDLARRILSSDILLPKFQRDFVWDRPQILQLWDSVARGYPVGSILLWQSRQELASQNQIADLPIKGPRPDYPVNYLLDGQQRLSSICGAMFWNGKDPDSPWNIAYDLRETKFIHLDTLDDPPSHQIRVNKLADPAEFFKHVYGLDSLKSADRDQLKSRAEELFRRFKDYKIASVTLGDMLIEDVAPIFERINSQGTPLTIVDLMRAATWSPEFDLIDSIDAILSDLASKGFSEIDKKALLRNLNAATGGGFSADSISEHLRKHSAKQLKEGVQAIHTGYKKAVDFLSTQIKVPSARVIPYSNQFVVLSEAFRLIPNPSAAQYKAISEWFWRTSHSEYFSGWNTGMMSRDIAALQAFANGRTASIELDAQKPLPSIWASRAFRLNNAHSKLLAIVLGVHDPIDLLTIQAVDTSNALDWTNSKEFHHFFPREYLTKCGYTKNEVNALANIIFLTSASNKRISARAPSDYLKEVEAAAGAQLDEVLASNLITRDAFNAAKADDYKEFLKLRATEIDRRISGLANW